MEKIVIQPFLINVIIREPSCVLGELYAIIPLTRHGIKFTTFTIILSLYSSTSLSLTGLTHIRTIVFAFYLHVSSSHWPILTH
jgi:hypothetical protein